MTQAKRDVRCECGALVARTEVTRVDSIRRINTVLVQGRWVHGRVRALGCRTCGAVNEITITSSRPTKVAGEVPREVCRCGRVHPGPRCLSDDDRRVPVTVTLPPEVKKFLDAQADGRSAAVETGLRLLEEARVRGPAVGGSESRVAPGQLADEERSAPPTVPVTPTTHTPPN